MKKKLSLGIVLFSALLLSACSDSTTKKEIAKTTESAVEQSETTQASDSLEVKDGPLTKIGQWKTADTLGRVELLKINESKQSVVITEGLTFTFESIKLLHADDIEYVNSASLFTDKTEGNYIQIVAALENNTDSEYDSVYPGTLVLSDGTQIEHSRSFSTSTGAKPHAKNNYILLFYFVGEQEPEFFKAYFDNVTDGEGFGINGLSAEAEIRF